MMALGLLGLALAQPKLIGVQPSYLDARQSFVSPVPLTLSGTGFEEGMTLELLLPDGQPPQRLPVQRQSGVRAEVLLPPGLSAGRYDLRLWGPERADACRPELLHVVAPACTDRGLDYPPGDRALSTEQHAQLADLAACRSAEGARSLILLAHAGPGEGVDRAPATSPGASVRLGYQPALASARVEEAAADLKDINIPITKITLLRPLPDRAAEAERGALRVLAPREEPQGLWACPLDGGEEAARCLWEAGGRGVLLVPGPGEDLEALAARWQAQQVAVEWAAPGPEALVLPLRPEPAPERRLPLPGCVAPPERPSPIPPEAPPRAWLWMGSVGAGLVGTPRNPQVLSAQTHADLRLGMDQGPFLGLSGALSLGEAAGEPPPGSLTLMLGWETPLPDRSPAFVWIGPWLSQPALAAGVGVPLLDALDGRLRPIFELRGAMGLRPEAPWSLGASLSLAWRSPHPLPARPDDEPTLP